jgi:DNA polymerase elongation subunit (family B)
MSKKDDKNFLTFRCKHRHSALTHPGCYLKFLNGGELPMKLPKVLLFDIETSPLEAYVFQKSIYRANITTDQVISEWFMLTWSAKWLYDDTIMSARLTGKEAVNEDDSRITRGLWKLLDEADIVIAHNGDGFDVPNMNTRFIVNGLNPPSPYQTIDTMLVARKQFGFTHNSLNALAKIFGFDAKMDTDFDLWKRAKSGDEKALAYMQEYNMGDVTLLEKVYLKLRPWIRNHPNVGLYIDSDETVCPNCGNKDITWLTNKYHYTGASKFPLFVCKCGAYGRGRKSVVSKEVKENLGMALPMK